MRDTFTRRRRRRLLCVMFYVRCKLHYFDLLWICWATNPQRARRRVDPMRRRACCFDHKSDDFSTYCGFCCSTCCTTNLQQIEVMEFGLYIPRSPWVQPRSGVSISSRLIFRSPSTSNVQKAWQTSFSKGEWILSEQNFSAQLYL